MKGHPQTLQTRLKISKSKKGQGLGFKHSLETRKKLSLAKLGKPRPYLVGKKFTDEHRRKISESHKGAKCYRWKGGITKLKHRGIEYKIWRSNVFTRDNWVCKTCGVRGGKLEAHHIKSWANYPELRFDIENGITLCVECHKLTDNYCGKTR